MHRSEPIKKLKFLVLAVALGASVAGFASVDGERVAIDRPQPLTLTEDTATPTAAERLAARGGGSTLRVGSSVVDCDYTSLSEALDAASSGDTILLESTTALYEGDTLRVVQSEHDHSRRLRRLPG